MLALDALVVIPLGLLFVETDEPTPLFVWVILVAILVTLAGYLLAVTAFFWSMRYEIDEAELRLRYGPLLAYRIPLADIDAVRREDLRWTWWSSMRVPGLALWGVPYKEIGTVRMCSKRVPEDVTLIEAGDLMYGCSPEEPERFGAALRAGSGRSFR